MSGIIHLLPLYDFMELTGTTLLYISTHSFTGHSRSVGIVTRLGTDDQDISVQLLIMAKDVSLLQSIQISSVTHPASYSIGARYLLPR